MALITINGKAYMSKNIEGSQKTMFYGIDSPYGLIYYGTFPPQKSLLTKEDANSQNNPNNESKVSSNNQAK
jgi:hypothetical protein